MRPPSEAFEVSVDEEDQGSQPMLIVIGNRREEKDEIERLVVADNVVWLELVQRTRMDNVAAVLAERAVLPGALRLL